MPYFYCFSCHSCVTPGQPCTGPWHQERKSKHMGVVSLKNSINKDVIEQLYKKYANIIVYIRTYGYGSCPLPNGVNHKSDLYWPKNK